MLSRKCRVGQISIIFGDRRDLLAEYEMHTKKQQFADVAELVCDNCSGLLHKKWYVFA